MVGTVDSWPSDCQVTTHGRMSQLLCVPFPCFHPYMYSSQAPLWEDWGGGWWHNDLKHWRRRLSLRSLLRSLLTRKLKLDWWQASRRLGSYFYKWWHILPYTCRVKVLASLDVGIRDQFWRFESKNGEIDETFNSQKKPSSQCFPSDCTCLVNLELFVLLVEVSCGWALCENISGRLVFLKS